MDRIKIQDISIADRQRKEFDPDKVAELAKSIERSGLIHAPTLRRVDGIEEDTEGKSMPAHFALVAGERRIRALKLMRMSGIPMYRYNGELFHTDELPLVVLDNLNDLGYKEAELDENIRRLDLTWQERTAALQALHELRSSEDSTHTAKDTAKEIAEILNISPGAAENDLSQASVVQAKMDDPEVAKASSFQKAFKIAKRKIHEEKNAETASRMQEVGKIQHTLIIGDCTDYEDTWRHIPEERRFGTLIMDPPYGVGADNFGDAARLGHDYKDDPRQAEQLISEVIYQFTCVAATKCSAFVFCDINQFHFIRNQFEIRGFTVFRTPLIWTKGSFGHVPYATHGPRRVHELILYAHRGGKKLSRVFNDVLTNFPPVQNKSHAAEKPIELYRFLLQLSTFPGAHVIDPTCGSGTIFAAAQSLGLTATGFELDEKHAGVCKSKMVNARVDGGG